MIKTYNFGSIVPIVWLSVVATTVIVNGQSAETNHAQALDEFAAWQSFMNQDPYKLKAAALDTNETSTKRADAIGILGKEPLAHLDALEILIHDPQRHVRFAAIEAIDSVRPDLAYQELKQLYDQIARDMDAGPTLDLFLMSLGEHLARCGDGSAFPFIVQKLMESSQYGRTSSAIGTLGSFMYLRELKPYEPLVRFVDKSISNLPSLSGDEHRKSEKLITRACYQLAGMHAVETIPEFNRWLADTRTETIRDDLEYTLRWLHATQAGLDTGKPDKRDDPQFQRVPGVTPAWELPKAIRD